MTPGLCIEKQLLYFEHVQGINYSALLTGEILVNAHILFHLVFHKIIKMFKK